MSSFAELLTSYIAYRTLDEVSSLCEAKGLKISPSYISKLRSGARPAPDDEGAVRTLAQALGGDPEPLVMLAKLERQPKGAYKELLKSAIEAVAAQAELSRFLLGAVDHIWKLVGGPFEPGATSDNGLRFNIHRYLLSISAFDLDMKEADAAQSVRDFQDMLKHVEMPEAYELALREQPSLPVALRRKTEQELLYALAEAVDIPPSLLRELVSTLRKAAHLYTPEQRVAVDKALAPSCSIAPATETVVDNSEDGRIRFALADIETVLLKFPGILRCTVTTRYNSVSQERLVAYITLDPKETPSIWHLRSFLNDRLPDYMIPSLFMVLDEMPTNADGDINEKSLPVPPAMSRGWIRNCTVNHLTGAQESELTYLVSQMTIKSVEKLLKEHPAIRSCGVYDTMYGDGLCQVEAQILLRDGTDQPSDESLQEYLRRRNVSEMWVPKIFRYQGRIERHNSAVAEV